jgi:hypothetical protein
MASSFSSSILQLLNILFCRESLLALPAFLRGKLHWFTAADQLTFARLDNLNRVAADVALVDLV